MHFPQSWHKGPAIVLAKTQNVARSASLQQAKSVKPLHLAAPHCHSGYDNDTSHAAVLPAFDLHKSAPTVEYPG